MVLPASAAAYEDGGAAGENGGAADEDSGAVGAGEDALPDPIAVAFFSFFPCER